MLSLVFSLIGRIFAWLINAYITVLFVRMILDWVSVLVVPELLRTLVFARPCGGDQFAAGTVSPSLDMSR